MACKRLNPRRVKIHRSYTFEEAAQLLGVHKKTLRNWIRAGLPVMVSRRPHLIAGRDLKSFMEARRNKAKRSCGNGQLYCFKCREPRSPACDMLDFVPSTLVSGDLIGFCPDCQTLMYRKVSLAKLDVVKGSCTVAFPKGQERLTDNFQPSPIYHLATEVEPHD